LDQSQFTAGIKAANAGLQQTGKHLDDGTQSALNMTKAMLGMVGVQSGMAAVGQVVAAIGSGMQEAADYTKRVAESFGATRDAMREIAAIAGKGLTNEFAQGQLDVAKQAKILTPQEMNSGVLAFQQYGSAYIGDQGVDPVTGKDNGSRISQGQLDELLPSVFSAAKVQGIEQGAAGQIFAKIVQALPAHSKTADYKDTFAKVLEMAKNSAGSATLTAKNLAPFLSENVNAGGAFEPTMEGLMSATKIVSTVSESNPEEAGTYSRQMIQDLNRIDIKGKDNDFGITDDMTVEQKIGAIAAKWKAETGGKNFKKWYSQKLGGRMGNVQATAALTTLITKGVDGGFFATMEAKAAKVDGGTLDTALEAHLGTQGGRDDARKASTAIGEAERGLDWSDVEAMKARAKDELTNDPTHPFEQSWHGPIAALKNMVGGTSYQQQAINERALRDAQQDVRAAGGDPGIASTTTWGQHAIDSEIKRLVELQKQLVDMKRQQVGNVPPPMNGKPNAPAQMPR
jgi:hypothetical protein